MKNKLLTKQVLKISEGVFETVMDLLLWEIVYLGEASMTFSRNAWEPKVKADKFLEEINYQSIKSALARARRRGLVLSAKIRKGNPQITAAGRKRLNLLMPQYDSKRIWDGRLYLVTYDILETKRESRDLLREFLQRIGSASVQESVWLTPYNPRDLLGEFVNEQGIQGSIIVSDLGKDGSVGEEDIKELVYKIYKLEEINDQYREFLEKYEDNEVQPWEVKFAYLKILKQDSQLPFALLSNDWLGEKAYAVFLKSK